MDVEIVGDRHQRNGWNGGLEELGTGVGKIFAAEGLGGRNLTGEQGRGPLGFQGGSRNRSRWPNPGKRQV
jgi:hypothetical protein